MFLSTDTRQRFRIGRVRFGKTRPPLPVEDEAELEAGVAALAHPRVDEDADVFAGDGEDGLGEGGRRDQHGAPLVGLALLLRRLHGQRQLLVEHLRWHQLLIKRASGTVTSWLSNCRHLDRTEFPFETW